MAATTSFARRAAAALVVALASAWVPAAVVATGAPATSTTTTAPDDNGRAAGVDEVRARADSAASMLTESPLPAQWGRTLDGLLDDGLEQAAFDDGLAAVGRDVDAILGAVTAPDPSTLTITGASSTLPIQLDNSADVPLTVALEVRSPKLRIPNGLQTVTIPAASSITARVPVRARSYGTSTIEILLHSPDGRVVDGPIVLKASVTGLAGLSRVITVGAILVLASWWLSHLRRTRQAARAAALGPAGPPG